MLGLQPRQAAQQRGTFLPEREQAPAGGADGAFRGAQRVGGFSAILLGARELALQPFDAPAQRLQVVTWIGLRADADEDEERGSTGAPEPAGRLRGSGPAQVRAFPCAATA